MRGYTWHGLTMEDRFWSRVEKTEECWNWTGYINPLGYGMFSINQREKKYAHRLAYELIKGAIPKHLVLDHLCKNTRCVNPDHLEAVTQRTNVMRGNGVAVMKANQIHCIRGHPLEGAFLDVGSLKHGYRRCYACITMNHRVQWAIRQVKVTLTP